MMQLDEFCRVAGFDRQDYLALAPYWESAVATFDGMPEFLTVGFCEKYYPLTGGGDDGLKLIRQVSEKIAALPAVQLYAWTLYRGFFLEPDPGKLGSLPPLSRLLGDQAGILHLMVVIGGIPLVENTIKKLGLPIACAHDIVKWIGGAIDLYAVGHDGVPGHNLSQVFWIRNHIEGKLFRIGRLEYLLHPMPEWTPAVYRRKADGQVLALCRNGWKFNVEGFRVAAEADAAQTTRLEVYRDQVVGTPVSPRGYALIGRRVELDMAEWLPVVSPWEPVPSLHIPRGGGMTPELVTASLKEAMVFFREHFRFEPKMFVCSSWILNTDWEVELPESNLAKLMRMAYLTPAEPSNGTDGLFFIFGRSGDVDWSHYPADNSVRRAFHRLREKGRKLKSGALFILADDLDRLAEGCYRDSWKLD